MPALEIRISSRPKASIVLATQVSVCASLVTSTATPIARLAPPSSAATASAPFWLRSAITTLAPSLANSVAMSLPMPLAAPVTMATLFSSSMLFSRLTQVIVDDLAKTKRQICDDVGGRDDFEHRQFRDGSERVGMQIERARSGPSALQIDVLKVVFDELADPRAAIDMRYDLQKEIWRLERGLDNGVIGRLVLVTHSAGRHPHGAVIERTDESVDFGAQARLRQFLWKAPKLAPAGDRRIVVQEHTMRIAALAAAEGHRNHLAGFGVIAEAGRIRHTDKLVFDDGLIDLQRLRHQRAQLIRISPVRDDEIFPLTEAVGSRRKRGARQRHGKCPRPHITFLHGDSSH